MNSESYFRTIEVSDPRFETADLREVTVKSPALAQRADVTFHAPSRARAGRDVPLVILLHGVYGSHWAWSRKGAAHLTAARMQAAGELPDCILAMPSDGLWGDGSGYLPHLLQNFEHWIADEVPRLAREVFPAVTERSPVCLAGLSMGGFGAMRIGGKHPGLFRAVAGLSSVTDFSQLNKYVEERPGSFTVQAEDYSVLDTWIRQKHRPLPALRFDCGTEDGLLEANRHLHRGLTEAGIAHTYVENPGKHEWPYWERHLPDVLRFFAQSMGPLGG